MFVHEFVSPSVRKLRYAVSSSWFSVEPKTIEIEIVCCRKFSLVIVLLNQKLRRRGYSSKMKTPSATRALSLVAEAPRIAAPGSATGKSAVDVRVAGLTAFDAFEAQLKGLCLKEYPCGNGSWVRRSTSFLTSGIFLFDSGIFFVFLDTSSHL